MALKIAFLNKYPQYISRSVEKPEAILGLVIVLFLGAFLRFYQIGAESYWIDEMYTVVEGQQSIVQLLHSGRLDQPPAYYLPFHLWIQIFGATEVSTRSFSTLVGIGSLILIYLVGKELFSAQVGLLSAFLMAISEFQIMYAQQARYYTFFELTTLLSFLFFIRMHQRQKRFHLVLYAVSTTLMIYSHAFGIFIIVAQNLCFLFQIKKLRNLVAAWLACQAFILLAVMPYFFPLFIGQGVVEEAVSNTAPAPPPSLWQPLNSIYRFFMPLRFEQSWTVMFANYLIAIGFLGASIVFYALRQGPRKWTGSVREWIFNLKKPGHRLDELYLVICWLVCPLLLSFIVSWVVVPIFNHRYNIGAAPALYLLLALLILEIRKVMPLIFSLSALLILIVPGLRYYYVTDINQQWREATQYVAKNSAKSELIIFPPYADIDLKLKMTQWYVKEDLRGCGLDMQLSESEIWNSLLECVSGRDRFWVIAFTDDPMNQRIQSFFLGPSQTHFHLLEQRKFVELSVYLLELTQQ